MELQMILQVKELALLIMIDTKNNNLSFNTFNILFLTYELDLQTFVDIIDLRIMSDQEPAFGDDWEEQLEKEQEKKKEEEEKKETTQAKQSNQLPQQTESSSKKKIVDPKQLLKEKIEQYKQESMENFEERYADITEKNKPLLKTPIPSMLKTGKDFTKFGKQVALRFNQQCQGKTQLDDNKMQGFVNQILLSIYERLTWNNIAKIQAKLKIALNQRKDMQKKWEKEKKKKNMGKKQQDIDFKSISSNKQANDDPFGGAGLNSKEEQQQRKQKPIVKQTEKKAPVQNDSDSDDFM